MEHSTPDLEQQHSQTHQDSAAKNFCKWNGNANVRVLNEVGIQTPPDFFAEYKAGQTEGAAHNKKTVLIGWLTFIAVVTYTTVAAFQSCAAAKQADAAKEANRLLEESTRARLSLAAKLLEMPVPGEHITLDIQANNVGHALAIVGDSTSNWIGITLPGGDMQVPDPTPTSLIEPGAPFEMVTTTLDTKSQDFLEGLPTLDENIVGHRTQYFFGKVDYETLGRVHKMTFCFYIIKANDFYRMTAGPQRGQPFAVHLCPKWNSSE